MSATSCSAPAAATSWPSELEVPLLGQMPLVPAVRDGADHGRPVVAAAPDGEASRALDEVAGRLLDLSAPRIRHPELRIAP